MSQILAQKKKYEPKFIFLTAKEDLVIFAILIACLLILKFLPINFIARIVIVIIIGLATAMFLLLDGITAVKNSLKYRTTLKDVSYYDPRMDDFIDVVSVKNNVAMRKDGTMLAFLRIIPKDLNIMGQEEKQAVIDSYFQFLNSLDSDIQIVSRSVPIDIETWLYNMQKKVTSKSESKTYEFNVKRFENFKKWINSIISENSVRNRVFYIVISHKSEAKMLKGDLVKLAFKELVGAKTKISHADLSQLHLDLKDVNDKVLIYTEILGRMGVGVERLNNNQILSMYSGYSSDIEGIDTNYITPFMWPKRVEENE